MLAPFKDIGGHAAYVSNTTITIITVITTGTTVSQLRTPALAFADRATRTNTDSSCARTHTRANLRL